MKYDITIKNVLDMVLDPKNNLDPNMPLKDLLYHSPYFLYINGAANKFDTNCAGILDLIYSGKLTAYRLPTGELVIPYDAEVKE